MADYNRYQPFPSSPNPVTVEDVDRLKGVSEKTQQNIYAMKDTGFLDRCLFILDNHPQANSLWIDLMDTTGKVDPTRSEHVTFSQEERGFTFAPLSLELTGRVESVEYRLPDNSLIQQVLFYAAAYIPEGTSISYEISNDGQTFYPIAPSSGALISLPVAGARLKLRARVNRTSTAITPRLDGWAVLYVDAGVPALSIDNGSDLPPLDPVSQDPEALLLPHAHDGLDGWGVVSHRSLVEVGADDHHPKIHRHAGWPGENDRIELGVETKGVLPVSQVPAHITTGLPGSESIVMDALGQVTKVIGPGRADFVWYYGDGRVDYVITIIDELAAKEVYRYDAGGKIVGRDRTLYAANDPAIQLAISQR